MESAPKLTRRQFLGGVLGVASISAAGSLLAACAPQAVPGGGKTPDKVIWVSPRGTLEVMDDFNLWVCQKLGYFTDQNLTVELQPGPQEALAVTKLVGEKQADVGYPSPGVLLASIDAGIPVIMVWEMMMKQVFDFALPENSPITSVKDLAGKTIILGSEGWSVIVDPILVEAGVDPKSVKYAPAGQQWGQALAQGQGDAALAWRGLQSQWAAQGMKFKFLVGKTFSKHPANGYAIRKADLDDKAKVDIWRRFFKAVAMGLEFGRLNPRAAAQITYEQFPAIREQMKPQLALDSMVELGFNYFDGYKIGKGYGYSDLDGWNSYIDVVYKLGQIKSRPKTEDVVTNFFIEEANKFDKNKVKKDADSFKVSDDFKSLEIHEF